MGPLFILEEINVLFIIALLRGKPGRVAATPQENALIKFEEAVTSFCRQLIVAKRALITMVGLKLVDTYQASTKLVRSLGPRGDPFGALSDLHGKDCNNTDIGVLIELHRNQAISLSIPKGASG